MGNTVMPYVSASLVAQSILAPATPAATRARARAAAASRCTDRRARRPLGGRPAARDWADPDDRRRPDHLPTRVESVRAAREAVADRRELVVKFTVRRLLSRAKCVGTGRASRCRPIGFTRVSSWFARARPVA